MENNVGEICGNCASERKLKIQESLDKLLQMFTSNYKFFFVKKAFSQNDVTEHMWIKISPDNVNWETKILSGTLDNDPVYLTNVKDNDTVTLSFLDIEDLIDGEPI
jgi:uncharacterized protein YegJ (DUF2314 family)